MASLVLDCGLEQRLKAERALTGADRFDEVWEGIYTMAPLADDEHQELQGKLCAVLQLIVGWTGAGQVRPGVNVSDRADDWQFNYRCPDVAVFLPGTTARNLGAHWMGGPDFAIEIVSPQDRSREKLTFYASINVRELLILDRRPWQLELYQLEDGALELAGVARPDDADIVASKMLPLTVCFVPPKGAGLRPQIKLARTDTAEHWVI